MRLRARVQRATGETLHYRAHVEGFEAHRDEILATPSWVEIQPGEKAFFLLYMDENNQCLTDTWHQTVEQAKEQARHEFGISEEDWREV